MTATRTYRHQDGDSEDLDRNEIETGLPSMVMLCADSSCDNFWLFTQAFVT